MFSNTEGKIAVKAARDSIEASIKGYNQPGINYPNIFDKECGVFVSIKRYSSGDLRGCIGNPEPVLPLKTALEKAAKNATNDPRLPPLEVDELGDIIVEVTLITPPEEIEYKNPNELINLITCGIDGLIISKGQDKGLLLPQVPVNQGWDEEEFLDNTCKKAGLPSTAWQEGDCTVHKFQGEIFAEETPNGNIVRY